VAGSVEVVDRGVFQKHLGQHITRGIVLVAWKEGKVGISIGLLDGTATRWGGTAFRPRASPRWQTSPNAGSADPRRHRAHADPGRAARPQPQPPAPALPTEDHPSGGGPADALPWEGRAPAGNRMPQGQALPAWGLGGAGEWAQRERFGADEWGKPPRTRPWDRPGTGDLGDWIGNAKHGGRP
jgi:hypothetical protein